jgi:hypothetical protein
MTDTTWISLEAQELGTAGAHLRDTAITLRDCTSRLRGNCCSPGLGRHTAPLAAEAEVVAARTTALVEGYVRAAADVLQRAIAVAQQDQAGTASATAPAVDSGIFAGRDFYAEGVASATAAIARIPTVAPSSTSKSVNEIQVDAILRRSAMKRLNAVMGIGNPFLGLSKSGLSTYEHTFGHTFMGISSDDV